MSALQPLKTSEDDFRIAVVATAFTPRSHAHVITRRWYDPLPTDAGYEWTGPRTRIASLYLLQKSSTDESRPLIEEYGAREATDVRDALTLGTDALAVDAVMIIGEHGDFPYNELSQKLYPRKELFDQVMDVIEESGRCIPLYFDKHFSWNPEYAREMAVRLKRVGLPFFGGSCTPHNPMVPVPIPLAGRHIQRVAMTSYGELEGYHFHALEVLESVIENRAGGESGLQAITAWQGDSCWPAIKKGRLPFHLFDSALRVLDTDTRESAWTRIKEESEPIEIFELAYRDGLVATIVRLQGTLKAWAWACDVEGEEAPLAAAPVNGSRDLFHPHFARLARRIEDFFLTHEPPIPASRLLFTTLACAASMKALQWNGVPVTKDLP